MATSRVVNVRGCSCLRIQKLPSPKINFIRIFFLKWNADFFKGKEKKRRYKRRSKEDPEEGIQEQDGDGEGQSLMTSFVVELMMQLWFPQFSSLNHVICYDNAAPKKRGRPKKKPEEKVPQIPDRYHKFWIINWQRSTMMVSTWKVKTVFLYIPEPPCNVQNVERSWRVLDHWSRIWTCMRTCDPTHALRQVAVKGFVSRINSRYTWWFIAEIKRSNVGFAEDYSISQKILLAMNAHILVCYSIANL